MKKATFSIPEDTYESLSKISKLLGISKSAFLSELLRDSLGQMEGLVEDVLKNKPEDPTEADVIRFRGKSKDLVQERIENLERMKNDLFSK